MFLKVILSGQSSKSANGRGNGRTYTGRSTAGASPCAQPTALGPIPHHVIAMVCAQLHAKAFDLHVKIEHAVRKTVGKAVSGRFEPLATLGEGMPNTSRRMVMEPLIHLFSSEYTSVLLPEESGNSGAAPSYLILGV